MSDTQRQIQKIAAKGLQALRKWDDEKTAKVVMRQYLSEQGLKCKKKSKLQELLEERHKLALESEDPNVKLKAIDSALNMASGAEKVTNVNTQFNFGDFLNNLK